MTRPLVVLLVVLLIGGCKADATPLAAQGRASSVRSGALVDLLATACNHGDLGYPDKGGYQLVCDSGAWTFRFLGHRVVPPPQAGWVAHNGGSVAESSRLRVLTLPAGVATAYRGELRAAPSPPYHLICGLLAPANGLDASGAGWQEGSTGSMVVQALNGTISRLLTPSLDVGSYLSVAEESYGLLWIGMDRSATTRRHFVSATRGDWVERLSVDADDFLDGDQLWWGGGTLVGAADKQVVLFDWEVGSGLLVPE